MLKSMDELNLDNILSPEDIENLFTDTGDKEEPQDTPGDKDNEGEDKGKDKEEPIDLDSLFTSNKDDDEDKGAEDTNKKEEPSSAGSKQSTSDNSSVFSSITQALVEEGVFPELDEDAIKATNSAEAFKKLIEDKIQEGLDETNKRINEALGVGVEPNTIQQFENTLKQLDSVTEDFLGEESENAENLRKSLIYQDFINRGYSKDRAIREVNKSLNSGSDVEDAKEALQSNKEFYKEQYKKVVDERKKEQEKEVNELKDMADKLKTSILEDKNLFGDYEIDKKTRQKIVDNISKPVYTDNKTGRTYTALQQYEKNNRQEFVKNLGIIFTLTDGFKNLDGFVKGKVRKEVKKGLSELETKLNNTNRNSDGTLNFANNSDPQSFWSKGVTFDF
jgi:hypothetical protein